jgi:SAM-dependent methyltransferase
MSALADSSAVLDPERLLSQHQAALTLLQSRLADPQLSVLRWLDLACGKGQILAQLDENLTPLQRGKIEYVGFDLNVKFGQFTEMRAAQLALKSAKVEYGELTRFSEIVRKGLQFDFITFTNTIHEINPSNLAGILFDCICRLTPTGSLFVYDMETLPIPELGAVPWKAAEMASIVDALLGGVGVAGYKPAVGGWIHRTVRGWNILIEKSHILHENSGIEISRDQAIGLGCAKIIEVLQRRRDDCCRALESLTKYGSATEGENVQKLAALYEFWAVKRALGEV